MYSIVCPLRDTDKILRINQEAGSVENVFGVYRVHVVDVDSSVDLSSWDSEVASVVSDHHLALHSLPLG